METTNENIECPGNGSCLTLHSKIICNCNCVEVECPNILICGNKSPLFLLEFNGGVCLYCSMKIGRELSFLCKLETPCMICMENRGNFVNFPNCSHMCCIECFKKIYFFEVLFPDEPVYPNEQEDDNIVLSNWRKNWIEWNRRKQLYIRENFNFIGKCPLCRR